MVEFHVVVAMAQPSLFPTSAFTALIFSAAIAGAGSTMTSIGSGCAKRVGFVVGMSLWAVGPILVGVALVLRFDASAAISMPGRRDDICVVLRVLMPFRAMSDVGLPVATVIDGIPRILAGCAPIKVREMVVLRIIIAVASMCSIGSRPHEGFQNKGMHRHLFSFPISVKRTGEVTPSLDTTHQQWG